MLRRAASHAVAFLAPGSLLLGYHLGGWFTFATPLCLLVLLPLIDLLLGPDRANPSLEELERLRKSGVFRYLLYLWVPVQLALVVWGGFVASSGELESIALLGFVWSVGLCTGAVGITVAHELVHGASRVERALGKLLLMTVSYVHFAIEHVEGHHRRVATSSDPASAPPGRSFYAFYPRSVLGGFRSAWHLEKKRLATSGLAFWTIRNHMLVLIVSQLLLAIALGLVFGSRAVAFFLAQSVVAFSLLEIVNYIEHYGLERSQNTHGKWEPVSSAHSWNADFWLSNAFLFGLQRHSDHHLHPRRPYQSLRHFPESPQLPAGYAGMIWLAAMPPLWRRVMDGRLREWKLERRA